MKTKYFRELSALIVVLLSFLMLTACERNENIPTFTDQGNIGPEGGIVTTSNGASVEVPNGALNSTKTISITNKTGSDSIAESGYMIYEMKPDGLTFSDSVIITIPFDDSYLNLSNELEDYGIGVMVFQDSSWYRLRAEIDLAKKVARVKTLHFSKYVIRYPSRWTWYFDQYKNGPKKTINVPYYEQSDNWCAYNSLSMVLKYAGYSFKAPYLATLFDEPDSDDKSGMNVGEFLLISSVLNVFGISSRVTEVPFLSENELSGYILSELNNGNPVFIASQSIGHAIVVTGHDPTGFYINDPSGDFLKRTTTNFYYGQPMVHVTYDEFKTALNTIWDLVLNIAGFSVLGGEYTLVITSTGDKLNKGNSLNFFDGRVSLKIIDKDDPLLFQSPEGSDSKGELSFCGGYTSGYVYAAGTAITLPSAISCEPGIGFDGIDYIYFKPVITNSDLDNDVSYSLYFKIDDKDLAGSPKAILVGKGNFKKSTFISQLSNLKKGYHPVDVELRSGDKQVLYDSWEFNLQINNEYNPGSSDIVFNPNLTYGSVTDIDGNVYKTIQIGTQTWMAENLRTTKFNDGTNIDLVTDGFAWRDLSVPAYCWYNNDPASVKEIYGALYNWYAVNTGKLCPTGWHVPSLADWEKIGVNNFTSGGHYKETGTMHWQGDNLDATNSTGFTGLPSGCRMTTNLPDPGYRQMGFETYWWTSTTYSTYPYNAGTCAYDCRLYYNSNHFQVTFDGKTVGFPIRCIRD